MSKTSDDSLLACRVWAWLGTHINIGVCVYVGHSSAEQILLWITNLTSGAEWNYISSFGRWTRWYACARKSQSVCIIRQTVFDILFSEHLINPLNQLNSWCHAYAATIAFECLTVAVYGMTKSRKIKLFNKKIPHFNVFQKDSLWKIAPMGHVEIHQSFWFIFSGIVWLSMVAIWMKKKYYSSSSSSSIFNVNIITPKIIMILISG